MLTICSPQLGIARQTHSGGEVYDREVLTQLSNLGCKIEILLPKGRDYPKNIKNFNITFAPIKSIFPPYIFNLFALPYLFRTFRRTQFQILRIHSPYFVGPAAIIFKFFQPSVKLVASYLHLENNNLIFELINRLIIRKFDLIITISQATKEELIKRYRISGQKIFVTYPGVASVFRPQLKDNNLLKKLKLEGKFILLFLAGLKFRKNPQFLLDVLKKVNNDNTVLLIAGTGQAELFLRLKAKILGLANQVKFLGFIKELEKVKFYNLADLFLLPSKKEGFGMIVAEAGACGVPSIVSDHSSLPEVVKNGKTGFVLPLKVELWAEKINLLAGDTKLKTLMGGKARQFVLRNFSWEAAAKRQLEVMGQLLT